MTNVERLEKVAEVISRNAGRIHMIGIGGVGMAGLAHLLSRRGFAVDGCDQVCGPLCHWLAEAGIRIDHEHKESHADAACDLVIYTPAINNDARELSEFRKQGVLEARRGEVLPLLLKGLTSIAVAGSHGKTTTATFIAHMLKRCGLSVGWCIGGSAESPGGVACLPDECDVMVVEADESDGTLRLYNPDIAVVTNVDYDHMEHFDSAEDFEGCFAEFVAKAKRRVVYSADDPIASRLCSGIAKAVSFGAADGAGLSVSGMHLSGGRSEFNVSGLDAHDERLKLPCPGAHNVLNACASVVVGMEMGADIEAIRDALASVSLPDRRYQVVLDGEVRVISDYAHHPTEIKALIWTARREAKGRLRVVFQPHRYTRTKSLLYDFPASFNGVDELVLVPVYAASEPPIRGGGSHDLYACIRSAGSVERLLYSRSLSCAWEYLRRTLRAGDTLLVVGAGDVEQIAHWLKRDAVEGREAAVSGLYAELRDMCGVDALHLDYPIAKRTMFGSGGLADAFLQASSKEILAKTWAFCTRNGLRLHLLGGGGNIVVSDLGVRGVIVSLTGDSFGEISIDGETVHVGASVPIPALLARLEEAGLSGLEFLEGVPGSLGGAVRMNAGAYGGEVGDVLASIVCLDVDGNEIVLDEDGITFAYRSMTCLQGRIVMSASFKLKRVGSESVMWRRDEIRAKREWMKGQRSVGSVFKNPQGKHAGELIDDCAMKGAFVGGVSISERHANVFVNDGTGTSSDMLCLIDMVCAEVRALRSIVLEREVVILE